ncbi:MAG TPA: four helix bundle protein [Planctomycetota bacterium]|jgi:four helix bundle protein
MRINRVEEVEAWKTARELTRMIYRISDEYGFDADHNLRRQVRQAATSTMANIAEGFESGTDREFTRFLRIAKRSAAEVQSHLHVAIDCGYLRKEAFEAAYAKCEATKRLIGGFIRYLGKRRRKASPLEPPIGS